MHEANPLAQDGWEDAVHELNYEPHRLRELRMYEQGRNEETDRYFTAQGQMNHVYAVKQALLHVQTKLLMALDGIQNSDARTYMQLGALRRLMMLRSALNGIFHTAPPNRTEPMDQDELATTSAHLNSIYINIRGLLDNFAWAIAYEFAPQLLAGNKMSIGLYRPAFAQAVNSPAFDSITAATADWNAEFSRRRDPSAHRIPLAVASGILDEEELAQYRALEVARHEALAVADHVAHAALIEEQFGLGKFCPVFLHHPDEEKTPLYPTLVEDIGMAVGICEKLVKFVVGDVLERRDD